ncbi:MAG TPA: hypothetical protein VK703_10260 [Candidatus Acidoferrales bacterium]|jgi:hypothetical protein|nr:hypothetical protein [Candidatus Acidoferrales bacterium]
MKNRKMLLGLLGAMCTLALSSQIGSAQEKTAPSTAEVHVVITDMAVRSDSEVPRLGPNDVKVKQGKTFLQVTQLIPAQGDNAALQLMILIDDTLDPVVGGNLNDVKEFIKAQPPSTMIAIGYMSNATVNIVQNFTADHELAVNAVRLPRGALSTMDSPYLSLISVVKSWPQQKVRREVLMLSDGIDRLRGEKPEPSRLGPNYGPAVYHSMPTISVDANSASEISQRYNVIVHSLYAAGVGRAGRSSWDLQLGLGGLSKIADETGGECYSLGTSTLVSFKPYLERFQRTLDNQYYLVFLATTKKKAGLQRVNIRTEASNSEIAAPDNVWVPAAK